MKKCIVTGLMAWMVTWSAMGLELKVNDLNIGLLGGQGRITTGEVFIKNNYVSVRLDNNDWAIKQELDNLVVTYNNSNADVTLFEIHKQATFLKDLKEVMVRDSNLSLSDSLSLWASQISVTVKNDSITLDTITFKCPSIASSVAESCLNKSDSSIAELALPESLVNSILASALNAQEAEKLQELKDNSPIKIKDFLIGFNKNHFEGSAAIKIFLDVKFSFSGDVRIDFKKKQIVIANLDIRRGIIPLTGLLLTAIEQAKIKGVTVSDKTIFISL